MPNGYDYKRFIDRQANPYASARMLDMFRRGEIMPFYELYQQAITARGKIIEEHKREKDIIQFAFIVTNNRRNVLLTRRSKHDAGHPAGRAATTGHSVLIAWSPDRDRPPKCEDDIVTIYRSQIVDDSREVPVARFLGLIRNTFGEVIYYFYLFEIRYSSGRVILSGFRKDTDDLLLGFRKPDRPLFDRVMGYKADLRALSLLTGFDLSQYDYGGSEAIAQRPDSSPPFVANPYEVFICHATEDDDVATDYMRRLAKVRLAAWVDHHAREEARESLEEIATAINYCSVFMVICTPHTKKALGAIAEVRMAAERRRRDRNFVVLPIVTHGPRKREVIPGEIAHINARDMRGQICEESWKALVSSVLKHVEAAYDHF